MSNQTKESLTDLGAIYTQAKWAANANVSGNHEYRFAAMAPRHALALVRIARAARKVADRLGSSPTSQALHDALAEIMDTQDGSIHDKDCEKWWHNAGLLMLDAQTPCTCRREGAAQ